MSSSPAVSISTINIPLRPNTHRLTTTATDVCLRSSGDVCYRSCGGQASLVADEADADDDNHKIKRTIDLIQSSWVSADLSPSLEIHIDVAEGVVSNGDAVLADIGLAIISSDIWSNLRLDARITQSDVRQHRATLSLHLIIALQRQSNRPPAPGDAAPAKRLPYCLGNGDDDGMTGLLGSVRVLNLQRVVVRLDVRGEDEGGCEHTNHPPPTPETTAHNNDNDNNTTPKPSSKPRLDELSFISLIEDGLQGLFTAAAANTPRPINSSTHSKGVTLTQAAPSVFLPGYTTALSQRCRFIAMAARGITSMLKSARLNGGDDDDVSTVTANGRSSKDMLWAVLCRDVYRRVEGKVRRYPGVCLEGYRRVVGARVGDGCGREEGVAEAEHDDDDGDKPKQHDDGEEVWLIAEDELDDDDDEGLIIPEEGEEEEDEELWDDITEIDMPYTPAPVPLNPLNTPNTPNAYQNNANPSTPSSRLLSSDDFSLLHDISQQSSTLDTTATTHSANSARDSQGDADGPFSEFQILESEEILLGLSSPCPSQPVRYGDGDGDCEMGGTATMLRQDNSIDIPMPMLMPMAHCHHNPNLSSLHPSSPPVRIVDEDFDERLDGGDYNGGTTLSDERRNICIPPSSTPAPTSTRQQQHRLGWAYVVDNEISSDSGILLGEE